MASFGFISDGSLPVKNRTTVEPLFYGLSVRSHLSFKTRSNCYIAHDCYKWRTHFEFARRKFQFYCGFMD